MSDLEREARGFAVRWTGWLAVLIVVTLPAAAVVNIYVPGPVAGLVSFTLGLVAGLGFARLLIRDLVDQLRRYGR